MCPPLRVHGALLALALLITLAHVPSSAYAAPDQPTLLERRPIAESDVRPDRRIALRARLELGALGVAAHHIRYGSTTRVDYRKDADQDTLFFFARLSAELEIGGRHGLIFLYQPLALRTETVLRRELRVGETVFPAETPTKVGYGFDFYRIAYQYDVFADPRRELAFGAGFQIRNARVSFVSSDGERGFTQTNLGVVPLLRVRGRYLFDSALFIEGELDGWVSPVPGQGRDGEMALGAIADAAVRGGVVARPWLELFLTLRYLGGGFRGDGSEDTPLVGPDTWNSNWLHTIALSLGVGTR
jgi:hypothetical protein